MTELQIELSKAKEMLDYCRDAETRVMRGGQTIDFDDGDMRRSITRANVDLIAKRMAYWKKEIASLQSQIKRGGIPPRRYLVVR